jgi:hypothetical protein
MERETAMTRKVRMPLLFIEVPNWPYFLNYRTLSAHLSSNCSFCKWFKDPLSEVFYHEHLALSTGRKFRLSSGVQGGSQLQEKDRAKVHFLKIMSP